MRSLKIAILGSRGIPVTYSGVETSVAEIAPRLVERGHGVTVYTKADTAYDEPLYKGVRIKKVPAINTKHFETLTRVGLSCWQELFSQNDIVHFHALGPSVFSGLPRLVGKKTVVTVHGLDWQRQKWGRIATQSLKLGEYTSAKFPNATITVSRVHQAYYADKYRSINCVYIPNGVGLPDHQPANAIREYGLSDRNYILFLSRLVPEKGCHYLIEAYKTVETDLKLVIAGGSSYTDDYVHKLQRMSRAHPNIIFTGAVSGRLLEELYSNAFIYVLPSEVEGFSIALLEAMSYGLGVLTSDIPENLTVAGKCGYSFQSMNVADLARVLTKLIGQPEQVRSAGQAARRYVAKKYNWDSITTQLEKLYLSL